MCRGILPSSNTASTADTISAPCCHGSSGRASAPHPCPTGYSSWPIFTHEQSTDQRQNRLRKVRKQEGRCQLPALITRLTAIVVVANRHTPATLAAAD